MGSTGERKKTTTKKNRKLKQQPPLEFFYSLFIVCPCVDMPVDRCPMACVQLGCPILCIYISSGTRSQISVTAVSHGAVKKIKIK